MGAGKLTILEIPLNDLIGEHTDKEYPDPSVQVYCQKPNWQMWLD